MVKKAAIDVHGLQLKDKFQKTRWRIKHPSLDEGKVGKCLTHAYWNC
jgi:hypothetical protein